MKPISDTRKQQNHRNWRKNNTARALVIAAKKRAVRDGIVFEITHEDIEIPLHCPVFGTLLTRDYHGDPENYPSIDRLRPELGYVRNNVAVISRKANRIKSNANLLELVSIVEYLKGRLK